VIDCQFLQPALVDIPGKLMNGAGIVFNKLATVDFRFSGFDAPPNFISNCVFFN